jgi:phosphatidylglycerophosphatase A
MLPAAKRTRCFCHSRFDGMGMETIRIVSQRPPLPAGFLRDPMHFVALGFGTGCAKYAPGTVGTGAGVVIYLALVQLPDAAYLPITVLLFIFGIVVCGRTAADLGVHDHPAIVWDEVVGYLITMLAAPAGWRWVALGFGLFRLFDVLKPWPIRVIDRQVHGGLGIMLDDVLAGLFACGVLQWVAGFF